MRIDYPKIAFVGVPLLLMLWGMVFVMLVFVSRDIVISKYGAFAFFIASIPIYGYLSNRYAEKLRATVDDDVHSSIDNPQASSGLKRNMSMLDLWIIGVLIILSLTAIFVAQYRFNVSNTEIARAMKIAIPVLIVLEIIIKKTINSFRTHEGAPNKAL